VPLRGQVEIDENYFGGRRIPGKRGRGAFTKVPVFGLLKRQGKVYTQIVPNCSRLVLTAILKGKVALGSVIYSDGWKGYSGLVDLGYKKHHRVDHGRNRFVQRKAHINGIENFWGMPRCAWQSSVALAAPHSACTSKNVNSVSTIVVTICISCY
jgi:transposase